MDIVFKMGKNRKVPLERDGDEILFMQLAGKANLDLTMVDI